MAADAAVAVLPSESGTEFQLLNCVLVGASLLDLRFDIGSATVPIQVKFPALRIGLHQPQERGGVGKKQLALLGNFRCRKMGHETNNRFSNVSESLCTALTKVIVWHDVGHQPDFSRQWEGLGKPEPERMVGPV